MSVLFLFTPDDLNPGLTWIGECTVQYLGSARATANVVDSGARKKYKEVVDSTGMCDSV